MAKTRPALGRGLSALIPEAPAPRTRERPTEVDLDRLTPNRFQPRTVMDEPKLDGAVPFDPEQWCHPTDHRPSP